MSKKKFWEIQEARFLTSAGHPGEYPRPALPEVAFAGRSNVGKSSLLNLLARQKALAQTSRTPGRTRRINFFRINDLYDFVDLPGYGYAKAPVGEQEKWKDMIEPFLRENADLRLVIVLLDARRTPSEMDDQIVQYLNFHQVPVRLVLTKSDKLKHGALLQARKSIAAHYQLNEEHAPLPTSVTTGTGREELLREISQAVKDSSQ